MIQTVEERRVSRCVAMRRYRERHKEMVRERNRAYKAVPEHRERAKALARERYKRTKASRGPKVPKTRCIRGHELAGDNLTIAAGWRVCRTCKRIRDATYREKQPVGASSGVVARWRRDNPDRARAISALRKARKRGAGGKYTIEHMRAQYQRQRGLCYYCRGELNGQYDAEHKIPIVRGGTNDPANIVCACADCNRRKGTLTAEEFSLKRRCGGLVEVVEDS